MLWAAAAHLHALFGGRIVLLVAEGDDLQIRAAWPPDAQLDAAALERRALGAAEERARRLGNRHAAQRRIPVPPAGRRARRDRGLRLRAAIARTSRSPPEDERALTAILDQTAIALDRALLAREAVKAAAMQENEKVRDALLASLSHDLRTPLATIAGAATSLRALGDKMSAGGTGRTPVVDRGGDGAPRRASSPTSSTCRGSRRAASRSIAICVDVADVVQGAVERSRKAFPGSRSRSASRPICPSCAATTSCSSRCCSTCSTTRTNTGGDGGVDRHARKEGDEVVISVTDEGPGSSPADLERIFEKFYRGGRSDGRKPGTGLGLSICRGLIEAMGGTIVAQSPAVRRRGTRIVIRLARRRDETDRNAAGVMKGPRVLVVDDEPQIRGS